MREVVIDIEANSLTKPTQIWLIVCKDVQTGELQVFRNPTSNHQEKERWFAYANIPETRWIGHNILGYDCPVLGSLLGWSHPEIAGSCVDTLILSRLVDCQRSSHSLGNYGKEVGLPKIDFNDWTQWSQEMEDYCVRDVDINLMVYHKLSSSIHLPSLIVEQKFQLLINTLNTNGFSFNVPKGKKLLEDVQSQLDRLDQSIQKEFPPRLKMVKEVNPKVTKHGTLSKTDFRWVSDGDLSIYNGGPFCRCVWVPFNANSHKQLIGVLNDAGWNPVDKTATHIETEREINRLKYTHGEKKELDFNQLSDKLTELRKTGWKINENNLATLPEDAPTPARSLAKRILLESRRRTLTEWLELVGEDSRIHGKFYGIGAWTHRMSHQEPNTANIPTPDKLLGKDMRSLWQAPRNRLLVGVDAEGIQLRIFAHYINDEEFTNALVQGRKADKTDPHSLNQRILGDVCRSRQIAKRFIYALLLGAGITKLAQILETSEADTRSGLDRLLARYTGFADLKERVVPIDAKRGWFVGLDGRKVAIPGTTPGERKHLCMSGYLQNGEAVIMKHACLLWHDMLAKEDVGRWLFVDMVHDEWQTEVSNSMDKAIKIAKIQAESLKIVGEQLNLKCPLAGSYWSEDKNDFTIGTNWYATH